RRWGPYPIGPVPAVAFRYRVPCSPCVRWECAPLYCLRSITVDEVSEALSRLLDAGRERRRAGTRTGKCVPLERRVVTRSWEALSRSFELPVVHVAIAGDGTRVASRGDRPEDARADARVYGRGAAARDVQSSAALSRTLASVARQSYPRIEMIVGEPCADAASDRIVFPVRAGTEFDHSTVADHVARYVRDVGADDGRGGK
ncbi:MAG TPA: hypothetical protein VF166_01185, partial [Gemmatimonadaceae bacterium]